MRNEILGKKLGMTQIFANNGLVIPVTVIEAGPVSILQKKTEENDGYKALKVAFKETRESLLNKAELGQFKKANRFLATKRTEGISTTDIINRILIDYDRYVERNVKKGMKPKEINISNYKYFACRINLLWKSMEKRREVNPKHYYFILWRGKARYLKNNSVSDGK